MKRLEELIHSIRHWYYTRKGFEYDHAKRMWYKYRSHCHDEPVSQVKVKDQYRWRCDACLKLCNTVQQIVT